ncbi:MAG: DUF3160 domain-containing protein [Synergistaceae bacterium]|nr:DUF3160 domain-containing protein [Synergistaceae bacterium]
MKTTMKRLWLLATLCVLTAAPLCGGAFAAEARRYMVVSDIAAITKSPNARYKVEQGFIAEAPGINGAVIYGNIVTVTKTDASGKYGYVSFLGANGWVKMSALQKMPGYQSFKPEPFRFAADKIELFLTPGAHPLNKYAPKGAPFDLYAGEVTDGVGTYKDKNGVEWTLLRFGSVGGDVPRHAWTKSSNVLRLSGYKPNFTKVDPRMIPRSLRSFGKVPEKFLPSIEKNGFAADASPILPEYINVDDMADVYGEMYNTPKFITSDLFLHAFHLVFSHGLKKMETSVFAPKLEKMLQGSLARLSAMEKNTNNKTLAPTFASARDFLTVPYLLLRPDANIPASKAAKDEVSRIVKAEGVSVSGISGKKEDYTFYKPRGHYTASEALSRYFRSVAYLGGMPVILADNDPRDTKRANAALATVLCEVFADSDMRNQWDAIREPLAYLVGEADDASIREFAPVVKKVIGGDLNKLADKGALDRLYKEFKMASPQPRIIDRKASRINMSRAERLAETASFRLMGRSFVLDAWAFSLLTSDPVSTPDAPRNLPLAEDFMAVLGSKTADKYLDGERKKFSAYDATLKQVKADADGYFGEGSKNVYTDCLSALKTLFAEKGSKQLFFNSPLWDVKKLVTAMASWTELKHDTVLYAKQSGAEMGDGEGGYSAEPFRVPRPKGYVEPTPRTFGAICGSLDRMRELIVKYKLEANGDTRAKIEALREYTAICRDIAAKEVADKPLNDDDYKYINDVALYINENLLLDGYADPTDKKTADSLKMALVTDIATDFIDNRVLQVATGTPRRIFVFVDDKHAGPRLTVGCMYSFYQFARPLSEGRMTDEEWKKKVYDKNAQRELEPLMPQWSKQLFVR